MAADGPVADESPSSARNAVGDHATANDTLGFAPYVEAVCAFLTAKQTSPPLTMSIEGEWGSGKSSFMLQVEAKITGLSRSDVFRSHAPIAWGGDSPTGSLWRAIREARAVKQLPVIRFNAWRHDKQDALWAAFALAVSRRLRQRIGFWRGLMADAHLFLLRLSGIRGWLELLLAAVSVLVLVLSAGILGNDLRLRWVQHMHWSEHQHWWRQFANWLSNIFKDDEGMKSVYAAVLTRGAAAHGSWFAMLLVALAGLVKFWDQIKLPIAFDLKKYLSTPDYKGHSAFIESFHEDFARLIRAYAGDDRVFVFIDDLDRCDVPRAAELMQAINLMISDSGNLIFVLGMDREKVAAGLTQKYKDLLPYLPEYAPTGGGNPVAFGYSYLEKFIQLTFTLPVMAGQESLENFLSALVPVPARTSWKGAVWKHWKGRSSSWKSRMALGLRRRYASLRGPVDPFAYEVPVDAPSPPAAGPGRGRQARAEAMRAESRIARLRLKSAEDSAAVHEIVRMISPLFGNNPRRLKQFLSTYRLALALTDSQGILTAAPHQDGVTMQQLGKFVALLMKFPDLRGALTGQPGLLGELETSAVDWPKSATPENPNLRWLQSRPVRDLLAYRVPVSQSASLYGGPADFQFALLRLDVSRLMSLLPKAQPEPEVASQPPLAATPEPASSPEQSPPQAYAAVTEQAEAPVSSSAVASQTGEPGSGVTSSPPPKSAARRRGSQGGESKRRFPELFLGFASDYERIRRTMEFSDERTDAMTQLVNRVQAEAREFGADGSEETRKVLLAQDTDGARIVALGIASVRVSKANIPWLLGFLEKYRSRFEHYWTIRTISLHLRFVTPETARDVARIFETLPSMARDSARREEADVLLERLAPIFKAESFPSEAGPLSL